jgi:V/A-type H+-transporting ATPase subunit D
MRLRLPPGRAARLWLLHRIDTARRGYDVLDEKRRALLREEEQARVRAGEAERAWAESAAEARRWLLRASVLAGERPLRLARSYAGGPAEVELTWRNTLGVVNPAAAALSLPPPGRSAAFVGTSALVLAAEAHRRALEAAARLAVARETHERVAAELERTVRRLRAIERRWLPRHEGALESLELRLDEEEREESLRLRWARHRGAVGAASGSPAP